MQHIVLHTAERKSTQVEFYTFIAQKVAIFAEEIAKLHH